MTDQEDVKECIRLLSVTNALKELELGRLSREAKQTIGIGHLRRHGDGTIRLARKSRKF